MWDRIKRGFSIVSIVFTLVVLGLAIYGFLMDVELLNNFKMILGFIFIFIGVGSYKLSRNLHFKLIPINYIIPYGISIGLIFGLNYLLINYLPVFHMDLKKSISAYTIFYIIYVTYMILKDMNNKDKIHFS